MKGAIGVGIIGYGRSGKGIHAAYLATDPRRFRVNAVADPVPIRRKMAEEELGCDTCRDWRGLLGRDDVDLIVHAGPSHHHARQCLAFLKAGFHVLCEKPVARRVKEVGDLIRTARKAKRVMAPFHNSRYHPVFIQARKVVESGILGRIVMVKARRSAFKRRWDWQTLRANNGGSLLNVGLHQLDQALVLAGMDTVPRITCSMDRVLTYGDAEDHVKLLMQARGYPTVDFEVSLCCAFPGDGISVYGSRGGLRVSGQTVEWKYYDPRRQTKRKLVREPLSDAQGRPVYCRDDIKWKKKTWANPYGNQLEYGIRAYYGMLYRTLTRGVPLEITMDEVRRETAIVEECYRQNPVSRMPKADLPK